jgi:uncharacterized membrane protein
MNNSQSPKTDRSAGQFVSQLVSAAGFGLMLAGFVLILLQGGADSFPGASAVPLVEMTRITEVPLALLLVSAGILLLAFLPAIRVAVKLIGSLRERHFLTALVAVIVLVELLFSMGSG